MDLIKLLVNATESKSICFLCLKHCRQEKNCDHSTVFNITGKLFNISITLVDMITELFPGFDIISEQSCNNCSDIILKMYIAIKENHIRKSYLEHSIELLNKIINREIKTDLNSIKIALPNIETYYKEKNYKTILSQTKDTKCTNKSGTIVKEISIDNITLQMKNEMLRADSKENFHNSNKIQNEAIINDNRATECLKQNDNSINSVEQTKENRKMENNSQICHICGKTFKNPRSLKLHVNDHVEKKCPYCNKILKSSSHFALHLKKHEGVTRKRLRIPKKYGCSYCLKNTTTKSDLEAHINRLHLKIKPYSCEECNKKFFSKSHLKGHMKSHNLKSECCNICGKLFQYKKTLQFHLQLHNNEKNYECSVCLKKFVNISRRTEHFKRCHSEHFLNCNECDKKFVLQKDLNRHLRQLHTKSDFKPNNYRYLETKNY